MTALCLLSGAAGAEEVSLPAAFAAAKAALVDLRTPGIGD
jgi:hypothetical protein